MFPENSYVEILMPNVVILRSGTLGMHLGHEDGALGMAVEVPEFTSPSVRI